MDFCWNKNKQIRQKIIFKSTVEFVWHILLHMKFSLFLMILFWYQLSEHVQLLFDTFNVGDEPEKT